MKRFLKNFLIRATGVALGLSIWGMAKADDRNSCLFDPQRGARDRVADLDRDALRRLDHWRSEFDLWLFEHWRFDGRDDFRSFDYRSSDYNQNDFGPFDDWRFDYDKNHLQPFDLERDDLRHSEARLFIV